MRKESKTKSIDVGCELITTRFGRHFRRKVDNNTMLHTAEIQDGYDWGRLNLASVTEESSLHDFLRTAELAGTEFQAEKLNIKLINPRPEVVLLSNLQQQQMEQNLEELHNMLKVPRRPRWTYGTTANELKSAEETSFYNWRQSLALLQEDHHLLLTPYEKNLEFWRNLWRVVERSDVVVQIVDARNPLLFRCLDLERYVKEVNRDKINMILVNKSDMLSEQQRQYWANYFDARGIRAAFFSTTLSAEDSKKFPKKNSDTESNSENESNSCTGSSPSEISLETLKSLVTEINKSLKVVADLQVKLLELIRERSATNNEQNKNNAKVLSREELITLFKNIYIGKTYTKGVTTIGLVGYPNVGKSSIINALMIKKKVRVSATPGKTKHFQTLRLKHDLILCDCPSFVMPSFVLTKADMILNGILPIDQMRDHVPPVNLLCQRIPRHVLEDKYGIIIAKPTEGEDENRPTNSEELLLAYGYNRGFMTAHGQPDQSRSARYICKDYVNGKLLYCVAPPNVPQEEYHVFPPRTRKEIEEKKLPNRQQRAMRINTKSASTEIVEQQ